MSLGDEARQVTDGDQTTTGKDTDWYQMIFRRFHGPTKLKDYCKTYRNHGKFDIKCVEFTYSMVLDRL